MSDACCIFGAGPFFGLARPLSPGTLVIAADGGYQHCIQAGLHPHLLLGDFDSLSEPPVGLTTQRFPAEKDDTDMMLAIKAGLSRGKRSFHLYGGTGGRLDHTIGNLQALLYLARHHARGYLYDDQFVFTAIQGSSLHLPARADGIFSVFCLGDDARGVSIRGGQYPLNDVVLTASFPVGVSNHFIGKPVEISVAQGSLVIGWELN